MSESIENGQNHGLPRTGVTVYSRLFCRNPNDLYGLYCPGCGHRVCNISVFSNEWTGYCPNCTVKHNVHSVVAVPDRLSLADSYPVEDVRSVWLGYLDDVARWEYEELEFDDVLDLANRVGVDWSPEDPLFRRRVSALDGHNRDDTVRTQMIYTKTDHYNLDPHLRTSELTYYHLHGYLPMWAQEEIALDHGLDGWGMWAAYELVNRELEYRQALGETVPLDGVAWDETIPEGVESFLQSVVRRYNLKFDARELVKSYRRVEEVIDEMYAMRDEYHEDWARSLTTEHGHKSFEADWHDARHEITTPNSFDTLEEAELWVASLEPRFDDEWEQTLDEARVRAGDLDAVGFDTMGTQVMNQ